MNKVKYKKIFLGGALAFTFFVSGFGFVSAETATTTTPENNTCNLNAALDDLLTVKDGSLTGVSRDRAEFKARKAVVVQTIICANQEISETKSKLNSLDLNIPEDESLRIQFLDSLKNSESNYALFSEQVATSTGLIEVKAIAEDILTWRKSEYLPLLSQINDFILVITNEESTKIAKARFDKISSTISILRLSNVPTIKNLLAESAALTDKADKLNSEAHSLVLSYLISPELTGTTSSSSAMLFATGTINFSDATTTNHSLKSSSGVGSAVSKSASSTPVTAVSLVKASINSLRGAYNNYLKISTSVKSILGL